MNFRVRRGTSPEINLTPMIDILFMVLMFLLLTTTFREFTFIRVTLPESSTGNRGAARQSGNIKILVEANGTLYVGEQPVTLEELGRMLNAVRDKDEIDVLLAADEHLDHGRVVEVMDLVRRAGIYRLSIETLSEVAPAGS